MGSTSLSAFPGTALLAIALTGWFVAQPEGRREEVARLLGNTLAREKQVSLADVAWDLDQPYYANDYVAARSGGDFVLVLEGNKPRVNGQGA